MVSASQLQAASANNYKYAMSNDQYKALANEQTTQQQQGKPLTTEEAYRQRKGVSTEKPASAQPVQAAQVAAAQPAQTAQSGGGATAARVATQSVAPINKTSGIPQDETFKYSMSNAQNNKFVRENQSKVAQGQPALTELQFRRNIGMDTSTVGGTYTAPRVTNNSAAPGTSATSTKGVADRNNAAQGSGDQKIAAVKAANPTNNNASAQTGTAQQAQAQVVSASDTQKQKDAAAAKKAQEAAQAAAAAKKAADAKRAAEQEAVAKEKAAAVARAEAKKIADAKARADAEKKAKDLQEKADAAKKAAKAAKDDADAKAKLANIHGESAYYAEIAARTGNTSAAKKSAEAAKNVKQATAQVQKTEAKAKVLGVKDRTGQVLLKSGAWISQYEKKGNDSADNVTLHTASLSALEQKKRKEAYQNRQSQRSTEKLLGLGTKSSVLDYDGKAGKLGIKAQDKKFNDFVAFKEADQKKLDSAVEIALAEAHKINPKGSKEYFDGVANVARRNQMSATAVMKEDSAKIRAKASDVVSSILPDLDKIVKVRDDFLSGITVKVTQPKKETLEYTLSDVQKKYQKKVKGNVVTGGLLKFTEDEYNSIRDDPVLYAAETAVVAAGGAVFGAGASGLKMAVNPKLAKIASKAATKTGNAAVKESLSWASKHGVDAALVGVPMVTAAESGREYFTSPEYKSLSVKEQDLAKTQYVAGLFKAGKDLVIAAPGFKYGASEFEATAGRIKSMKATVSTTVKPKASGLENAAPSEFDITNIARSVKTTAPKTTVQKVADLKTQVKKLESKGRVSDKPKIKSLKRQINAIELKSKNSNTVAELKSKNYPGIKEIANDQAFDKEFTGLREMKEFADRYGGSSLNKAEPTEADLSKALSRVSSAEKTQMSRIKRGLPETKSSTVVEKTTRAGYVKETPGTLKSLASEAGEASIKKAKVTVSKAKTAAKSVMTPKIRPTVSGVAKYKDTSAQAMHGKLKLRAQARRIEGALEKSRVSGDVSKELYYTAQSAKFKLTHGISTEKAAKAYQFRAKTTKTLGQKRAEYAQGREAHKTAKKSKTPVQDYVPEDITDIVKTAKAFESSPAGKAKARQAVHSKQNRLLKDAAKDKKESGLPRDITNVTGYRKAKGSASGKLTMKEIALFKAKSGSKYTAKNTGSLDTLKAEASKFNKAAAEKRTKAESDTEKLRKISEEMGDTVKKDYTIVDPMTDPIYRKWEAAQKAASARTEARRSYKESSAGKAVEDKAWNTRLETRRAESTAKEAEKAFKESPAGKALEEKLFNEWVGRQKSKTLVREVKATPAGRALAEKKFDRWLEMQRRKSQMRERQSSPEGLKKKVAHENARDIALQKRVTAKKELASMKSAEVEAEALLKQINALEKGLKTEGIETSWKNIWETREKVSAPVKSERFTKAVREKVRAEKVLKEDIPDVLKDILKVKESAPTDKFSAAVKRTKARNAEIQKTYSSESSSKSVNSGKLQLLQKVESVERVKAAKTESAVKTIERLERVKEKRGLTAAEKKVLERARIRQKVEVKVKSEEKQKVKIKPKITPRVVKGSSYFYAASAASTNMDPVYARYPAGAQTPGGRIQTPSGIVGFNSEIGFEKTVRHIEATVNRLDKIVRPNIPVKPNIAIPTKVDSTIRHAVIIPTETANAVKPELKPDVLIKPGVIVKPKVDSIIKPIVDQVNKIKEVSVVGTPSYRLPPRSPENIALIARKKKSGPDETKKNGGGVIKMQRRLHNKLGGFDSIFSDLIVKSSRKTASAKTKTKKVYNTPNFYF